MCGVCGATLGEMTSLWCACLYVECNLWLACLCVYVCVYVCFEVECAERVCMHACIILGCVHIYLCILRTETCTLRVKQAL